MPKSSSDQLKDAQIAAQKLYAQNAQQFGDIAGKAAQGNPAAGMFNPDWYANAQANVQGGMDSAGAQQDAMGKQADQYDQWASGVGGQLAPGLAQQQQNATNQQSQADWLWKNPGYTDQEKQAMSTSAQTPVAGSYTSAQGDLRNSAARTGNTAAYGAQAADLARKKASDLSMVGLNTQGQFANQRIAGQQFANQAQGQAGQAQGNVNTMNQGAAGLQSNIFNTGANMRLGLAGSQLQRSAAGNASQGTMQNAQALSMAPAQLAAGLYGTSVSGQTGMAGSQTQLALKPGFGQALATGAGAAIGGLI